MEGIWRLSETRVGIELLGQLKNVNKATVPTRKNIPLLTSPSLQSSIFPKKYLSFQNESLSNINVEN